RRHLFRECSIVLGFAIEPSTSIVYDSHLNSYITFCQLHHHPIDPTQDTLSYYVIWLTHHIEPHLVDNYLSSITSRLELLFPDVCNARHSPLISQTLQGCKCRLSKPICWTLPLGVDNLTCIRNRIAQWGVPHYDDKLFLAMLLTGFRSLQWLGELTWPDASKHQSYKKVALHHTFSSNTNLIQYFSGHSMRAGSATALTASGMALELIQAAGRWTSDEFNKYICQHPFVLHALMHGTT
ncbi:hypothetical protein BDR06DRAFT_888969, partial [Suillus hirtellus]